MPGSATVAIISGQAQHERIKHAEVERKAKDAGSTLPIATQEAHTPTIQQAPTSPVADPASEPVGAGVYVALLVIALLCALGNVLNSTRQNPPSRYNYREKDY